MFTICGEADTLVQYDIPPHGISPQVSRLQTEVVPWGQVLTRDRIWMSDYADWVQIEVLQAARLHSLSRLYTRSATARLDSSGKAVTMALMTDTLVLRKLAL